MGLSPRVRGNPAEDAAPAVKQGSIPARAGEPRLRCCLTVHRRVYPRACGGTGTAPAFEDTTEGLSRACGGTRRARSHRSPICGLSPRVRGNPPTHIPRPHSERVYARVVRGSIPPGRPCGPRQAGLSPRVPGNRCSDRISPEFAGVYPRACGGTMDPPVPCLRWHRSGLSPRVRGNRTPVMLSGE